MTSFVDVFGDYTVPPSGMAYSAVELTEDSELLWPALNELVSSNQFFATSILEVSPGSSALTLKLPSTAVVSLGKDLLIRNTGGFTLQINNAVDGSVTTLDPGIAKYFFSKDADSNTWGVLTYGAGTSGSEATELAGAGLTAVSNKLQLFAQYSEINSSRALNFSTDRFRTLNVTAAGTTLSLTEASTTAATGFIALVRNSSDGSVTLQSTVGQTVDGAASKVLAPRESCILLQATSSWVTVGYGRDVEFAFAEVVVDVTAGNVTLTTADVAGRMVRVVGTPTANRLITLPPVNNIYFVNVTSSVGAYTVGFRIGATSPATLSADQSTVLYSNGAQVFIAVNTTSTSVMQLLDGSAGAPALNFLADPDTGIFRKNVDELGLAVGGVERLLVTSAGASITGALSVTDAATSRTSLGLGTIATQAASNVAITGGTISGITDLAIADGGTGASTAGAARNALGLAIGTNVQAYNAGLQSIAGLTTAADKMIYTTASDTYAVVDLTAAGRALLDDVDAAAQRTTLGLGSVDNVSAASLRDRATHTGEQAISTITGLQAALDAAGAGWSTTTTAVSKTLVDLERCTVTVAGCTITLPTTPATGASVGVSVNNFVNTVVAGNGKSITGPNGVDTDVTINAAYRTVHFYFDGTTWRTF